MRCHLHIAFWSHTRIFCDGSQSANHNGMGLEIHNDSEGSPTNQPETATIPMGDVGTRAKSVICPMLGTILLYEQLSESSTASSADLNKKNGPVFLKGSTQTKVNIIPEDR